MAAPEVEVLEATKNGDVICFRLRLDGGREVWREEEDFGWLLHCVRTETIRQGIIYPPLPHIEASDARQAEKKAREQYGPGANIVASESLSFDCKQLERFMKTLQQHPAISSTQALRDFLSAEEAPTRVPIKVSRVLKWSNSVNEKMKASYKDVSPFFEDERNKTACALQRYRSANSHFKKMVNCKLRTAFAEREVGNEGAGDCGSSEIRQQIRRLGSVFSKAFASFALVNETAAEELSRSLGRFLDLYEGYYDSLREALFKRTTLLVAYQDALKAAEKAKPAHRTAAEELRAAKEKEFEDFSGELKEEIVRFHRERIEATHRAVAQVARVATKAAVDRHAAMAEELNLVKNLKL